MGKNFPYWRVVIVAERFSACQW